MIQVSAAYSGMEALKQIIAGKPNQLDMNVSVEADEAFLRELKQTDPERYAALNSTLRMAEKARDLLAERNQKSSDRIAIRRFKKTGVLPTGWRLCPYCQEPFRPERENASFCSRRCANRQKPAAA